MKSEPETYSIDDLRRDGHCAWEGVRNYQARNLMRDEMRVGDGVLFYHSSTTPAGVAGVARVASAARPDATAWDARSPYFDPRAGRENPRWFCVDVAFVAKFTNPVTLERLRMEKGLEGMLVLKRGMRLSVQPVTPAHFRRVLALAGWRAADAP